MSDTIAGIEAGVGIGTAIGGAPGAIVGGIAGGLLGGALDISGAATTAEDTYQTAKLQETEAQANIGIYQQYLSAFPGYAQTKETEYKTQEAQDLADRLSTMGMRGITTGGGTSGAAAYGTQQSLYEQGYTNLVQQLNLEQGTAQAKLGVYKASLTEAQKAEKNAEGSVGGFFEQLGNWLGGKGWTM